MAGFQEVKYVTDQCVKGRKLGLRPEEKLNGDGTPTATDLFRSFDWLIADAQPGDTLFFHYSGHGTFLQGPSPSQCNNRDEALVLPGRGFDTVTGDEIFRRLVERLPAGVHLFAIVDACHSGTIFDLPYNWNHWDYLRSHRTRPVFSAGQFDWEWAQSPEELGRTFPLRGTVTLITGSQAWQTSGDMGMTGGGVLTNALVTKHRHKAGRGWKESPGVLTTALEKGWSWTQTIMEAIDHVTGGKVKAVSNTQVPNFGASHRFDLDTKFTLDSPQQLEENEKPGKCRNR